MRARLCLVCGRTPTPSCEMHPRAEWQFRLGMTPKEFKDIAMFELVMARHRALKGSANGAADSLPDA